MTLLKRLRLLRKTSYSPGIAPSISSFRVLRQEHGLFDQPCAKLNLASLHSPKRVPAFTQGYKFVGGKRASGQCRGRFIAPIADLSAPIGINLRAERRSLDVVGTRFIASHGRGGGGNVTLDLTPWDAINRVPTTFSLRSFRFGWCLL